jgi:zeaxanthin glucosyltransferase
LANILIAMQPYIGHINPTFRFANDLREQGHTVWYIAHVESFRRDIEEQKFHFYYLDLNLPSLGERNEMHLLEALSPWVGYMRDARRVSEAILRGILNGSAYRSMLKEVSPDLVIIESTSGIISFALPLIAWNIPIIMVSPVLPLDMDENVPPLSSHFIPTDSYFSKLRCSLDWLCHRAMAWGKSKLNNLVGLSDDDRILRVARHYGLHPEQILSREVRWYSESTYTALRLPELILCPKAFDFPRKQRPNRYYVDSSTRPDYCEDVVLSDIDWERLKPEATIVYCSFGSRVVKHAKTKRLLAEIIRAFSREKKFLLIVRVDDGFDLGAVGSVLENIVITSKWVPQMALLRRASVHITHGGFGSVRESIECEVPMIVIPFDSDHPGNAARIVYHGLGERLFPGQVTGTKLIELAERICFSPSYKQNVRKMKLEFERQYRTECAADVIERFLPVTSAPEARTGIG